jgi:GT2 family glycosyltransferase
MSASKAAHRICLVTVTYGDRRRYVEKALQSAIESGIVDLVVVDNGSNAPLEPDLRLRFGDAIKVIRFDQNMGSALAFKTGIQAAIDQPCELVMLLDDDNVLTSDCVQKLVEEWIGQNPRYGSDNCMILAHRPGHAPPEKIGEKSGFLGFHLKDVPKKIAKRLTRSASEGPLLGRTRVVQVAHAPYSGLLFHRSVVTRHGLPDERFVLYGDDSEFTYRVTAGGGFIGRVMDAKLVELEHSWNVAPQGNGFIRTLVSAGSECRAYYSVRNQCYFEAHCLHGNRVVRSANKLVFLILAGASCLLFGSRRRWRMLRNAINEGNSGQLGFASSKAIRLP